MSDNGELYPWDIDNIGIVFLLEGQTVHIDWNIDGGHPTLVVEFTFDTGVLMIKQTSHDENLNHVFLLTFIQNGEETCEFWGLLEMEYQGFGKRFTVTSQEFSTEVGVNALRQILPDENIDGSVLDSSSVSNPSINLNERFADAVDDASIDDASVEDASVGETPFQV